MDYGLALSGGGAIVIYSIRYLQLIGKFIV